MPTNRLRNFFYILILALISINSLPASAQFPGMGTSEAAPEVNLNELNPQEARSHLATLTDSETRQILMGQIEAREKIPPQTDMMDISYLSNAIMELQQRSEQFDAGLKNIMEASPDYAQNLSSAMTTLFLKNNESIFTRVILTLGSVLIASIFFARLAFRVVNNLRESLRQDGQFEIYIRLTRSITGMLLDLAKVALFLMLSIAATLMLVTKGSNIHIFASSVLFFTASIWALHDIFKELLFSPVCKTLFIKDNQSRKIFYWSMIGFFTPIFLAIYSKPVLFTLEFPIESLQLNVLSLFSISMLILIIGIFLIARIKRESDGKDNEGDVLKFAVSNNRYWLIIIVLLAFYFIIFKSTVIHAELTEIERLNSSNIYYALLMFIFMPMYMRIVKLLIISQNTPENTEKEDEPANKQQGNILSKYSKWVLGLFSVPYGILVFLFTLEGVNIGLLSWLSDGKGSEFGEAATSIIMTCMLGVVSWNVVNSYVNRNLPATALDPTILMSGEGGGHSSATRFQTILPILRNFALVIIMIAVIFSVLTSLGVNTVPLLAGAGIMSIAIGFGAQKLVQDVVSGLFFLFEDAFRIGEYIDTGSLVGTVESTSVRSLRLRHHLGAVQTIPYGEIPSVKNLSRDFIIMKLKFRVPFDTDIEEVRKTIKKVGQKLLLDEEIGPDFISPLKSQGVHTAEEDALVIRMKFTAKPGKQWLIKRAAYVGVQEALAAKGIHFASRQVTVHVPENESSEPKDMKLAAAGAAAQVIENEKKDNKPKDPMADM